MSIVTGDQMADPAESVQLGVVVLHPRDAVAAATGGADRLLLTIDPEDGHYSPEPAAVSAVVRETDLPVWVVLRTRQEDPLPKVRGGRLVTLGETFLELGARGLAYGFVDRNLEIDREGCAEMCAELGGTPWMFHGFDQALETDRAWRDVRGLPGLESVITAGSTRGLTHGADELIATVSRDPRIAALVTAGGGLAPDVVPWLVRAGVRRFAIGSAARAGSSWTRGLVDVDRVRSWRMLVDDALSRALGIPVDD
jgi:copper homeostasis protein